MLAYNHSKQLAGIATHVQVYVKDGCLVDAAVGRGLRPWLVDKAAREAAEPELDLYTAYRQERQGKARSWARDGGSQVRADTKGPCVAHSSNAGRRRGRAAYERTDAMSASPREACCSVGDCVTAVCSIAIGQQVG